MKLNKKPLYFFMWIFFVGCHYVYEAINEVHSSSSVETYYQCGVHETRSNMLLELLADILGEPCFNYLRTQEQLGKCLVIFTGDNSPKIIKYIYICTIPKKNTHLVIKHVYCTFYR